MLGSSTAWRALPNYQFFPTSLAKEVSRWVCWEGSSVGEEGIKNQILLGVSPPPRRDEDTVQRLRGGGVERLLLRRRGGSVLGVRPEGSRCQQAGQQAPEGSPHELLFLTCAQVRHLPGAPPCPLSFSPLSDCLHSHSSSFGQLGLVYIVRQR